MFVFSHHHYHIMYKVVSHFTGWCIYTLCYSWFSRVPYNNFAVVELLKINSNTVPLVTTEGDYWATMCGQLRISVMNPQF